MRGSYLPSMLEVLRCDGQPEEHGWPYLITNPVDVSTWRPPTDVGELYGRDNVHHALHIDALIQSIDEGNAVILLLNLSQGLLCA